jgi:AraC-like DNA-binding protein
MILNREASMDEKFLSKAKEIIDANIGNSNFSVRQLAHEMHLCRAQLFRKIKALCGVAPCQFIQDARLQHAARLIEWKVSTLSQIGYSVGFNEPSYFSKRFRKKFGVSPSAYNHQSV